MADQHLTLPELREVIDRIDRDLVALPDAARRAGGLQGIVHEDISMLRGNRDECRFAASVNRFGRGINLPGRVVHRMGKRRPANRHAESVCNLRITADRRPLLASDSAMPGHGRALVVRRRLASAILVSMNTLACSASGTFSLQVSRQIAQASESAWSTTFVENDSKVMSRW